MTDTLKFWAWDSLKTTTAIIGASALNLQGQLQRVVPSGSIGLYLGDGVLYAVARDLVNYVSQDDSNLATMNYIGMVDDIAYFSIASGIIDNSGLDAVLFENIDKFSPFGKSLNTSLTVGVAVSGATAVANLLDRATGDNMLFDFIRRPVSTTLNRLNGR